MDKLTVTQADEDAADALYNLVSDWQDKYEDWQLAFARHRIAAWNTRQPTQSDALREALETARDYVADVAVGIIHFNDNIKAMAAEDLTRIDAALQEQSK